MTQCGRVMVFHCRHNQDKFKITMEKKLKDGKALYEEAIGYQTEGIEEPAKRLESWRKAYDCAEEGAKMGSAECIYLLGVFHVKEVGCRQDFDKAFAYIKQSADMGYFEAEWLLGDWYHRGIGTTKNIFEARAWYEKSAEKGFPPAQFALGLWYRERMNDDLAVSYFSNALKNEDFSDVLKYEEFVSLYYPADVIEDAKEYVAELIPNS